MSSNATINSDAAHPLGLGHHGTWISALGLMICIMGCHPQTTKTQSLPPPVAAPVAPLPQKAYPTFYITANHLVLRACPGVDCPQTSTLEMNTEVEKMGEIKNWAQIKVKKDGAIGYVSLRYLSPQPIKVARYTKKKPKKMKVRKAVQPPAVAGQERKAGSEKLEPSPPIPRVM